jgi:hypothetical protein
MKIRDSSSEDDSRERRFSPSDGFLLYWDYTLALLKNEIPHGTALQLVYGIYNSGGMALVEPHLV